MTHYRDQPWFWVYLHSPGPSEGVWTFAGSLGRCLNTQPSVFKHLPRDPANVNTLKTLVDRYSCINLMQFFFYQGIFTFKMQEKCDTHLRHSVSLRSTDNFWTNRCSWMFCLCCFGALSEREMFVKHDKNQMKRTRKYSGFSVNISALD